MGRVKTVSAVLWGLDRDKHLNDLTREGVRVSLWSVVYRMKCN